MGTDGSLGVNLGIRGFTFTEFNPNINKIGRLTPDGFFAEFGLITSSSQPAFIANGGDGNLWFTEANAGNIALITRAGFVTEFTIPTTSSVPAGIVAVQGSIWFTEAGGNKIGVLKVVKTSRH